MNSKIAIQRSKQGLEKFDTASNANFKNWDYEDAFNKALTDWYRRQDWGTNQKQQGEESSEMVSDDLQVFLTEKKMSVSDLKIYFDTVKLPENYRYYNRLSVFASKGTCSKSLIPSSFIESANVDVYLSDWGKSPSFEFEQCFHIILGNKFRVYTNEDFKIDYVKLFYFRAPKNISCEIKDMDIEWEIKEDVAELVIDEAIKNLAGNIEHMSANQLAEKRTIINN